MKAAAEKTTKLGITTILGSIIVLITIIWASYSFILVQFAQPRSEIPHEQYDEVDPWAYDIPWAGGRSNWFDNVNYTDVPLDQELPPGLLENLDNIVFYVIPEDPPQLWRDGAYDVYDGSSWGKSDPDSEWALTSAQLITRGEAILLGNQIYTVILNITAGPVVGAIDLPSLFPQILVIEDSFTTGRIVDGTYEQDAQNRLIQYDLSTDIYGTVRFTPLIEAPTGENVLVSYELTYVDQDLNNVAATALTGINAPTDISQMYGRPSLEGVSLTPNVIGNISQFEGVGDDAYETAMAVSLYFQNNYDLILTEPDVYDRPSSDEEVTDWFLERGGGLPVDFATAYCVFLRYLDIPARLTMGYAVGDAEGGYRSIRVRHMIFWAEVYIPMSDPYVEGEWIQVLPLPLGGELPENVESGNVQLVVVHSRYSEGWVEIGQEFQIYGAILTNGLFVTTPELITFYDETDSVAVGSAYINSIDGFATLNYTFPTSASVGQHNITGLYVGPSYSLENYTLIYAVAQPVPNHSLNDMHGVFEPSGTVDVDVKLGFDNYTAYWLDVIHTHGVMTVGGLPYQPTYNRDMQILWDEVLVGSASIQPDGSYQYDITANPSNPSMSLGNHTVYAYYAGDYDPYGIPLLLPARSPDSIIEMWGKISIQMTPNTTVADRGDTIQFQGTLELLNGTPLDSQLMNVTFDSTLFANPSTNTSGSFSADFQVPGSTSYGLHYAYANWTSTIPLVVGNSSALIPITIELSGATITMSSIPQAPQVVHPTEPITISGFLTDNHNSSGLVGKSVDIYWDNGTDVVNIATVTTTAGGQYEYSYVVPNRVGSATYWSNYTSFDPLYGSAQSDSLSISIEPWPTAVSVFTEQLYYHLDESMLIWGQLTLQLSGTPLAFTNLTINWYNQTLTRTFTVQTNSAGWYSYTYDFLMSDGPSAVTLTASFVSSDITVADCTGSTAVTLQLYQIDLTVSTDSSSYHLNETVQISGQLSFQHNATPIQNQQVIIYWLWDNGTLMTLYPNLTDSLGGFSYNYVCSPSKDYVSVFLIWAEFTGSTVNPLWANATSIPALSISLVSYQSQFNVGATTPVHIDQSVLIDGFLFYQGSSTPVVGATVMVYILDNSIWTLVGSDETDTSGYFQYSYRFATDVQGPGTYYFKCNYTSTDPLVTGTESSLLTVDAEALAVVWSINTPPSQVYRGAAVIMTGYATLDNGTVLAGCTVELTWDNIVQATNTTGIDGSFYLVYEVPWDEPVGSVVLYVSLLPPTSYYSNLNSSDGFTEVWDIIVVSLYSQSVTVVRRGDSLTVSGIITNAQGELAGVPVYVTGDGSSISSTGSTTTNGRFSLSATIPADWSAGDHAITVVVASPYYNVSGPSTPWSVELHLRSFLSLDYPDGIPDLMPGESFLLELSLLDENDNPIGAAVRVYLGTTEVGQYTMGPSSSRVVTITVPGSWTDSGYYTMRAVYDGQAYVDTAEVQDGGSIHVFFEAVFAPSSTVSISGNPLVVTGVLSDEHGNPVADREVIVGFQGTQYSVTTGLDGNFSVRLMDSPTDGTYTYSITVTSPVEDYFVNDYTIQVQTGGIMQGNILDIVIPVASVIGAIVVVLLYLYYVRGMGRSSVRVTAVDIPGKLRNIKKLADAGKYGAAITLAYRTFEQMCGTRTGSERVSSETAHDYMERILKSIPLDSVLIEEFVRTYEEARFSQHEVTREKYEMAIKIFTDLYPRVDTGVMAPS